MVNTRTGEKELLSRERRSKFVVVETVYLIVRSCNIPNPDDPGGDVPPVSAEGPAGTAQEAHEEHPEPGNGERYKTPTKNTVFLLVSKRTNKLTKYSVIFFTFPVAD